MKGRNSSFGNSWDLLGNKDHSETIAVVGEIDNSESLRIGLSAMQLRNIGYDYGPISVSLENGGETVLVEVYNAFGRDAQQKSSIWISRGLASELGISLDDKIVLTRDIDEQGRIKYLAETQTKNPLGRGWGRIKTPAEAIVSAIDRDGYNSEVYRIGLSAMQMDNLGVERQSEPLNNKTLLSVIKKNDKGLLDGQDFGVLKVEHNGRVVPTTVYNAFGMRSIGGCGVRVSSTLAGELGLKLEDRVKLYK